MYTNTHSTEVASGSAVEKMGVVVEGAVTLWKQPVEHCSVLQFVAMCCSVSTRRERENESELETKEKRVRILYRDIYEFF